MHTIFYTLCIICEDSNENFPNMFDFFCIFLGEYEKETGKKMVAKASEGAELLASMKDDVFCENRLYFSKSTRSMHVAQLVKNQKDQKNTRNGEPFHPNSHFSKRLMHS